CQFGKPIVARYGIDGDRSFGRTEGRFLDLATGRQAGQCLTAGKQRRQANRREESRGVAQRAGRPQIGPSSADLAKRWHNVLPVGGAPAWEFRATSICSLGPPLPHNGPQVAV